MLDAPLGFCPLCRRIVLLDQTPAECARDQHCFEESCPLAGSFMGIEFRDGEMGMPSPRVCAVGGRKR